MIEFSLKLQPGVELPTDRDIRNEFAALITTLIAERQEMSDINVQVKAADNISQDQQVVNAPVILP